MSSDAIIFLTYNVRVGTNIADYRTFLRNVDSPFFNSQPGIVRYENWETVKVKYGGAQFSFFDIIYVDDVSTAAQIFTTPAIVAFSAAWHARWGVDPAPTPATIAKNYQAAIYQRAGKAAAPRSATALIELREHVSRNKTLASDADRWVIAQRLVDPMPATELNIYYAANADMQAADARTRWVSGRRLTTRK